MRFYRFNPTNLKRPGNPVATKELEYDGSNFAAYLHHIHSGDRKTFLTIESELKKSFPTIEELNSPMIPAGTAAGIKERWFDRTFSGDQLSDGLVGFLANLVVLYGPDRPRLLCTEEPENYVNPRLMEQLVRMLKHSAEESQVILTTHSPSLLNYLELADIIIVTGGRSGTSVERAHDKVDLQESLKGWALGDAYVSGVLGGVP
jgi:predicted ATPase